MMNLDVCMVRSIQIIVAHKGVPVAIFKHKGLGDDYVSDNAQGGIAIGVFSWNDTILTLREALVKVME